ncbi:MAG TPA: ATP-binding cassette domain-containing protein [Solirubrobacteraceae bacterium]|nr:ATP-binding cassette domain-containing protein [Solirubrobacteraceae bacterium]
MDAPLLTLEAVSKSYWRGPHELRVLTELSLEMGAGEFHVVWGKPGAGKTTLLKIAAGLETCDRGSVRFAGIDLACIPEAEHARLMREQIAWIRRGGPSSDLPILDYVALPLLPTFGHRRAYATARDAMARVGIGECVQRRWKSLSDGERALVGIARGVARSPSLLLVDDPTTNLGLREREQLAALLRDLADSGVGVLMTVPDMKEMMSAHQIATLSGGRLLAPPEIAPHAPPPERPENVIAFPGARRRG